MLAVKVGDLGVKGRELALVHFCVDAPGGCSVYKASLRPQ
jgi:hypothetical protein